MKAQLIESRDVERDYGFTGCEAIVDHPTLGRILIVDGYGGENTPSGGCVRWRHGSIYQLLPDDDLDTLEDGRWNDSMSQLDAILYGIDESRPLHTGSVSILHIAKSVGLGRV